MVRHTASGWQVQNMMCDVTSCNSSSRAGSSMCVLVDSVKRLLNLVHVLCCDICVDVPELSSHCKSNIKARMNKFVKSSSCNLWILRFR